MDSTVAILYRCCGNCIVDHRERRKLRSPAGVVIVPTLIKVLNNHFAGQKSRDEIEHLIFPLGVEPYICRQPCLARLQRLQKLENDLRELQSNILGSLDSLYPLLQPEPLTSSTRKRTPTQHIEPPPAKRLDIESPVARRQLKFVGALDVGKSPSVAVCRAACLIFVLNYNIPLAHV